MIHEVMKMTENMVIAVNKGLSTIELKRIAKEDGMDVTSHSCRIRSIQGVSTVQVSKRLTRMKINLLQLRVKMI